MSFSRPIQWYHCHADPFWSDSTFMKKLFSIDYSGVTYKSYSVPAMLDRPLQLPFFTKYLYLYRAHTVYVPSSELGLPQPLSRKRVCPPLLPDQRVGGHTRLLVRGWGSPNSDDWRKRLHSAYSVSFPFIFFGFFYGF
jgi:hypothetical protein